MLTVQESSVSKCFAVEPLFLLIPLISTIVTMNTNYSFQKSLFNQAKY